MPSPFWSAIDMIEVPARSPASAPLMAKPWSAPLARRSARSIPPPKACPQTTKAVPAPPSIPGAPISISPSPSPFKSATELTVAPARSPALMPSMMMSLGSTVSVTVVPPVDCPRCTTIRPASSALSSSPPTPTTTSAMPSPFRSAMDDTHAGTDTPASMLKSPGAFGSRRLAMPLLVKAEVMLIFVFGIGIRLSSAGQSGRNKGEEKHRKEVPMQDMWSLSRGLMNPVNVGFYSTVSRQAYL